MRLGIDVCVYCNGYLEPHFVNFVQKHYMLRMQEIKNLVEPAPGGRLLCDLHVYITIGGLNIRI